MTHRINSQKGIAQFLVIAVMAFLALGIPTATKLVQQNQENRSKAAEETSTTNLIDNSICGNPNMADLTESTNTENPQLLCKSGSVWQYTKMTLSDNGSYISCSLNNNCKNIDASKIVYNWRCVADSTINLSNIQIGSEEYKKIIQQTTICPPKEKSSSSVAKYCSTPKYEDLTSISDKDNPELLCKTGEVIEFKKITTTCPSTNPECTPSNGYTWTCRDENIKAKCKATEKKLSPTPTTQIPTTEIKVNPTSLNLKVGQSQNLTYILTPSKSTDKVKWSMSENSLVNIQQLALRCTDSTDTRCLETPGTSHLQVTALKAGTVKIKLITSSGKSTEATVVIDEKPQSEVINGSCGTVKYDVLTETSDKDNPQILCKSGTIAEFSKMTPNCSNPSTTSSCPPTFYAWVCSGSNGGKSVKCSIKSTASSTIPSTGIKTYPSSLKLKVGQIAKISYVLTPGNTTDTVSSSIAGPKGLVRFAQTTPPCPSGANCAPAAPGVKYYNVTALKSGSIKITFKTSSGKSASSIILINK